LRHVARIALLAAAEEPVSAHGSLGAARSAAAVPPLFHRAGFGTAVAVLKVAVVADGQKELFVRCTSERAQNQRPVGLRIDDAITIDVEL